MLYRRYRKATDEIFVFLYFHRDHAHNNNLILRFKYEFASEEQEELFQQGKSGQSRSDIGSHCRGRVKANISLGKSSCSECMYGCIPRAYEANDCLRTASVHSILQIF